MKNSEEITGFPVLMVFILSLILIILPWMVFGNNSVANHYSIGTAGLKPELICSYTYKENKISIFKSESANNPFSIKIQGKSFSRDLVVIETQKVSDKYVLAEKFGGKYVYYFTTWKSFEKITLDDLKQNCIDVIEGKTEIQTALSKT